jgi:hypothetical protein
MKHLSASVLALAMTATAATASAQVSSRPPSGYAQQDAYYDYARVLRVQPVYDSSYGGRYAASTGSERCVESRTYAGGSDERYSGGYNDRYYDRYNDRYTGGYDDRYDRRGYNDPYNDRYARDRYAGGYGGTGTGGTLATVIGGIVGAAVGSQVGGGSARYATSAIGSMVGGMAGRQIYEQTQRSRYPAGRVGRVVACDPVSVGDYEQGRGVSMYDVTYEYGGRTQTTRTSYHPGDRIRVRVDVRPE